MSVKRIIGICGAAGGGSAGAGKDAVADFLVKDHGLARIALADPMKRMIYGENLWPFNEEQMWGPSERRAEPPVGRKGPILREALQRLGTEWARALDEDVWVRKTLRMADHLLALGGLGYDPVRGLFIDHEPCPTPAGVVIPDVRFDNEAAAIRAAGGEVWKVVRPGVEGGAFLGGGVVGHTSEAGVSDDLIDRVLMNTGTLSDLQGLVAGALGLSRWMERSVP